MARGKDHAHAALPQATLDEVALTQYLADKVSRCLLRSLYADTDRCLCGIDRGIWSEGRGNRLWRVLTCAVVRCTSQQNRAAVGASPLR